MPPDLPAEIALMIRSKEFSRDSQQYSLSRHWGPSDRCRDNGLRTLSRSQTARRHAHRRRPERRQDLKRRVRRPRALHVTRRGLTFVTGALAASCIGALIYLGTLMQQPGLIATTDGAGQRERAGRQTGALRRLRDGP